MIKGAELLPPHSHPKKSARTWTRRKGASQLEITPKLAGVDRFFRTVGVGPARWLECYGVHEVRGRQTVKEFVRLEAAHDLNHLRQIDRILGGGRM